MFVVHLISTYNLDNYKMLRLLIQNGAAHNQVNLARKSALNLCTVTGKCINDQKNNDQTFLQMVFV